ncbi:hypothetical protein C0J52_03957 [Blattella germanica]|nr:hypothetical protein C0J52_03957 [Blattella germanica]
MFLGYFVHTCAPPSGFELEGSGNSKQNFSNRKAVATASRISPTGRQWQQQAEFLPSRVSPEGSGHSKQNFSKSKM